MTFKLDEFLPYRLSVAASQVSRRFSALYAAEAGLTIPEWRVLAHLAQSAEVSVRDINRHVNLDKSIVSRAASRLEEDGFVTKAGNDTDRRLIVLRLTPKGKALMERLTPLAQTFQQQLLSELGTDAHTLSQALEKLTVRGS